MSTRSVGPFTASPGVAEDIGPTGALRIPLTIRFEHKPWGTIPLEVSPAEGGSIDARGIELVRASPDLSVFGMAPTDRVPCLPVRYQIAQKLHACTEVFEDRDNARFRDLLDLILLSEVVDDDASASVRAACKEIFALRGKHPWPPVVVVLPAWPDGFAALANGIGFEPADVHVAARMVQGLIDRIDGAD